MMLTLTEIALLSGLFAILIHGSYLAKSVSKRETVTSEFAASFLIFFSGLWFIGPFTYPGFRKTRPLLAQACLRQLLAVTALLILVMLVSGWGVDFLPGRSNG
jgi:hypothetical protein